MQGALERALAHTEHLRRLAGGQPLDVAQDDGRALGGLQPPERALEVIAQLGALGAMVGRRVAVGAVLQRLVVERDLAARRWAALGAALGSVASP